MSFLVEEELIEFFTDVLQGHLSVHLLLKLHESSFAVVVVVEVAEHEFGTFCDLRVQVNVVFISCLKLAIRQLHLLQGLVVPVVELGTEILASDFI